MAGGGTAPSMKMSDVLILVGMSVLVGGLIMHMWVAPASLDSEDPTLESGASLLEEDTLTFEVEAASESEITIKVMDEGGATVADETWSVASGEGLEWEFKATEGGFYTYEVTFDSGDGEVIVDVSRQSMIDFIAYPLGILLIGYGLYKRSFEIDEVIDAELDA